jgi:hypothetical protein
LADQLAGQGVQRVVVESTSDYWRPFVYLLEAQALDAPFLAAALHGGAMIRAA